MQEGKDSLVLKVITDLKDLKADQDRGVPKVQKGIMVKMEHKYVININRISSKHTKPSSKLEHMKFMKWSFDGTLSIQK